MVDSIRDAKARLAEAAARGERVVVTEHGRPFVELVPAAGGTGMDFERAAAVRFALGIDGVTVVVPEGFDDAVFSRQVVLEPLREPLSFSE